MKARVLLLVMFMFLTGVVEAQVQSHVAIGDSLAFGFQEAKFYTLLFSGTYTPDAFNTGFVDVIDNYVRLSQPTFKTVNFSCPGETTTTLVSGNCQFHNVLLNLQLHQDYPPTTPQIYAAVQYLQAHPGEALLITVTIGANDMLNLVSDCANDPTCVQQGLPAVTNHATSTLSTILGIIKVVSPQSAVVYTNVPDPYLFTDPANAPAFASFNAAMGTAATQAGARVADWFGAEQNYDQSTLCILSYVCQGPLNDIHPTDFGYQVLAVQTLQALFQ